MCVIEKMMKNISCSPLNAVRLQLLNLKEKQELNYVRNLVVSLVKSGGNAVAKEIS